MEKAQCCICGKTLEGYLNNTRELSESVSLATATIGNRCQNCGAVFCQDESNKHLKHSFWHGYKKSICPKCGQLFGPGFILTSEPFSAQDKAEAKALADSIAASTPTPPRNFKFTYFLDPLTNEKLVDEIIFDKVGDKGFILTDRRLIYKTNAPPSSTLGMLTNENLRYLNYSLNIISEVTVKEGWTTTKFSMLANFDIRQVRDAWNFDKGPDILRFADNLRKISETKALTFLLPEGEELLYNHEGNLRRLHTYPFGEFKNTHNNHLGHFAITNQRLLLYEIDHLTGGKQNSGYGAPHLVYCSLPWTKIKHIQISSTMFGHDVDLMLHSHPLVWRVPGLRFLRDEDLVYSSVSKAVIVSEQAQASIPQLAQLQKISASDAREGETKQLFLEGDVEFELWKLIEPFLQKLPVTIQKK